MKVLVTLLFTSIALSAYCLDDIKIFNYGLASLEERLQMVERAEKTIDVEYYIYHTDTSGRIFTHALISKAKQGVKIRLLLDHFLVKNEITAFHAYELEKYGIQVKYFNPATILDITKGQYRNHRKVLIIDGKEAMTGGRNIGDEYFDLSTKFNFLDRDIEVQGEIVATILKTYDVLWSSPHSKKLLKPSIPTLANNDENDIVASTRYRSELARWKKSELSAKDFVNLNYFTSDFINKIREKGKEELQTEYQGKCQELSFISERPIVNIKNRKERLIKFDLYDRIVHAKKSIVFDSPYFIDTRESEAALKIALQNNVDIKFLTNGLNSTDAISVFGVFDSIVGKWVSRGIDPYVYKGEAPKNYETLNDQIKQARFGIHAKSFVFDDEDVVIGTFNFDPRSSNYNMEMALYCDNNPELAQVVKSSIYSRMESSLHLDSDESINKSRFYHVNFLKQLEFLLLKLPSTWFEYLL